MPFLLCDRERQRVTHSRVGHRLVNEADIYRFSDNVLVVLDGWGYWMTYFKRKYFIYQLLLSQTGVMLRGERSRNAKQNSLRFEWTSPKRHIRLGAGYNLRV